MSDVVLIDFKRVDRVEQIYIETVSHCVTMYHMEVTTAMLADAARVESGKLYVHGGGWDRIKAAGVPLTHPTLAVVLVLRIEYDEALEDIPISVTMETEDGKVLGPRIDGTINAGHPPGTVRGAPAFHPIALTVNGMRFENAGRFSFRVASGDEELTRIPFTVEIMRQPPQG